jgi:hypothetical protein
VRESVFTALVVITIVTSMMASPLMRRVLEPLKLTFA